MVECGRFQCSEIHSLLQLKVVAIVVLSALLTLFGLVRLALGVENPPGLPSPMHRVILWTQENPTNVGGYMLRWGTNSLNVSGVSSTSAVIQLDPGQQTLLIRAMAAVGTNNSDWSSNTVRLLKLTLESTTNGIVWGEETNWTWSIFPSPSNKLYRTRMDWSK
jgi:hypothetical protein